MLEQEAASMSLLALAPLLVVTTTAARGLGIGSLLLLVLFSSAMLSIFLRYILSLRWHLLASLLLLGCLICLLQRLVAVYFYDLSVTLDLYLPFIAINSLCFMQIEERYFRQHWRSCLQQAISYGLLITVYLIIIGALRECLGRGLLWTEFDTLLTLADSTTWSLPGDFSGIPVINTSAWVLFMLSMSIALIKSIMPVFRSRKPVASE